MARRWRLLLLLFAALAPLAAFAFFCPVSQIDQRPRCRPPHPPPSRSRRPGAAIAMSEAVEAVGSGSFQPAWVSPAAVPQQAAAELSQPPLSRFRCPRVPPSSSSTASPRTATKTRPGPRIPSQLRIVLTGFGPFHGVESNPAEALARRVGALVMENENGDDGAAAVGPFALSSSVVETSAEGAAEGLASIQRGLELEGLGEDDNLLFVHLGVRNDIEGFRLESVGYNEADFKVPDHRNFQPTGEAVSPTDGDTSSLLFSTLPLQSIMRSLHAHQGYTRSEVAISTDPGRFCCNYLYYRSLEFCRARGPHTAALFVHLPPFSRVDSDQQFAFIHRLLSTATAHFPHVGQTQGLLS